MRDFFAHKDQNHLETKYTITTPLMKFHNEVDSIVSIFSNPECCAVALPSMNFCISEKANHKNRMLLATDFQN